MSHGPCPSIPQTLRLQGDPSRHPAADFLPAVPVAPGSSDLRGQRPRREQGRGPGPRLNQKNVSPACLPSLPIYDVFNTRSSPLPQTLRPSPAALRPTGKLSLREPLCLHCQHLSPSGWGVDMPPGVGLVTCYLQIPGGGGRKLLGIVWSLPQAHRFCCKLPPPRPPLLWGRYLSSRRTTVCASCSVLPASPACWPPGESSPTSLMPGVLGPWSYLEGRAGWECFLRVTTRGHPSLCIIWVV